MSADSVPSSKTNIFQNKLIYCRHFRTYSRCAMLDWSDTVFRRRRYDEGTESAEAATSAQKADTILVYFRRKNSDISICFRLISDKLIYCRHFRTYSRCAMLDWSDTVFRRRNVTRRRISNTVLQPRYIHSFQKNIKYSYFIGLCRYKSRDTLRK
jgi:hypothetical protein